MIYLLHTIFNEHTDYSHQRGENLGLAYIASYIRRAGEDVSIRIINKMEDLSVVIDSKPLAVGLSPFVHEFDDAIKICKYIRLNSPHTTIIWGGIPATTCAKDILNEYKDVDIVICGEGEYTFVELINQLKQDKPINNVDGIAFRENDSVVFTTPRKPIENLDDLPIASHELLSDKRISFARISGSRGCYGNCTFCSTPFYYKNIVGYRWRGHSISRVVKEVKDIIKQYGVREFYFSDASIEDPPGIEGKNRIDLLAQNIIDEKINVYYQVFIRGNTFNKQDLPLIKKLKDSGLEKVLVGVESVSKELVKLFNKAASPEECINTIGLFREAGILVDLGFIFFTPYTRFEDLKGQADFLYKLGLCKQVSFFFTQLEIYLGTPIRKKVEKDNLLLPDVGYKDIFGYKFIDKNTEKVLNILRGLQSPATFNLMTLDSNTELLISRIKKECFAEEFLKIETLLNELHVNMNEYFYHAFLDILDLSYNNKPTDSVISEMEDKINFFTSHIVKIRRNIVVECSKRGISISKFSGKIN